MSSRAFSAIQIALKRLNFPESSGPQPERNGRPPLGISDRPDEALDLSKRAAPIVFRFGLRRLWFIRRIIEQVF